MSIACVAAHICPDPVRHRKAYGHKGKAMKKKREFLENSIIVAAHPGDEDVPRLAIDRLRQDGIGQRRPVDPGG